MPHECPDRASAGLPPPVQVARMRAGLPGVPINAADTESSMRAAAGELPTSWPAAEVRCMEAILHMHVGLMVPLFHMPSDRPFGADRKVRGRKV